MQKIIVALFCAIALAEDYQINRDDGLKASDWLLPVFIGVAVGLAMVMFGFLLWTKAEGFEVCAQSRAAAELAKIQGEMQAKKQLKEFMDDQDQTAV